jgi:hypothetical protein
LTTPKSPTWERMKPFGVGVSTWYLMSFTDYWQLFKSDPKQPGLRLLSGPSEGGGSLATGTPDLRSQNPWHRIAVMMP